MDYRGGDLDLRTPGNRSGAGGEGDRLDLNFGSRDFGDISSQSSASNAPIYVDDTLMAVCNHAYDVAVAHRSADVRIEHLLYALTRIDAAAEVLEAAGIRDAGLRREGATIIASEIPIGLTNGSSKPRRSGAFEEAIRLAAQQGYRRNRPASVSDLLHVFLEVKPDLPGLELLRRHTQRSYREPDDLAARSVVPARYSVQDYGGRYGQESWGRGDTAPETRPFRYEPQEPVDAMQNARLAELERLVIGLRDELGNERHLVSGLLGELKRDVSAQRNASSGLSALMQDRLASLEQSFTLGGTSDGGAAMREVMDRTSERLALVERGVSARVDDVNRQLSVISDKLNSGDIGGDLVDRERLARVSHQLEAVTDKLKALENATGDGDLDIDIMPILSRLEGVEKALRERDGVQGETLAAVTDRLKGLERMVGLQPDVQVDFSPIENRLLDLETAVLSQDNSTGGEGGSTRLEERIDTLENLFTEQFAAISNALSVDRSSDGDVATALQAEIKALSGAIVTGNASQERFASSIQSEVRSFSELGKRLSDMTREQDETTSLINQKFAALEQRIVQSDEAVVSGRADFVRELGDVHEAIMKLNSNQHAISQSIETWRGETVGSVNTMASRLTSFEERYDGPSDELRELSGNLDRMYRVTVERYHRRNRFWFWLFGTDDWIGASWPSQTARVENELAAMKRAAAQAREAEQQA